MKIIVELGCPTGGMQATVLALSTCLKRVASLVRKKSMNKKCLLQSVSGAHPTSHLMCTRGCLLSGKATETAHYHLVPRIIMMELYPNTSSWHRVQLSKGTTLPLLYVINNLEKCGFGMNSVIICNIANL